MVYFDPACTVISLLCDQCLEGSHVRVVRYDVVL